MPLKIFCQSSLPRAGSTLLQNILPAGARLRRAPQPHQQPGIQGAGPREDEARLSRFQPGGNGDLLRRADRQALRRREIARLGRAQHPSEGFALANDYLEVLGRDAVRYIQQNYGWYLQMFGYTVTPV
jgi:hypothetical protein